MVITVMIVMVAVRCGNDAISDSCNCSDSDDSGDNGRDDVAS